MDKACSSATDVAVDVSITSTVRSDGAVQVVKVVDIFDFVVVYGRLSWGGRKLLSGCVCRPRDLVSCG